LILTGYSRAATSTRCGTQMSQRAVHAETAAQTK